MSWKKVLKAHCGTEKKLEDGDPFEKLVGNQDEIDADGDGKITGNDFKILGRKSKLKKARDIKQVALSNGKTYPQNIKIFEATLKKEGGAAGIKNLVDASKLSKKEVKAILNVMKNIRIHKYGDIILMDGLPKGKGRGFTA
jgi:hypothetical protein